VITELKPEQDNEKSTCAPPSDEVVHEPVPPAQQQDDEVSCFPFQDFDDTLFRDSESEGGVVSPREADIPCYTIEEEGATQEDETMIHVEDTQFLRAPAQEEKVSYRPLQDFDNCLLYDLEKGEEMGEPSNVLNPPCYDTDTDIVDIDEFIHVGRRKWDIVGFDVDPIYDIESHSRLLPSQLSHQITFDFDQWQQGDDLFTDAHQTPEVGLIPCFLDDFRSYLEGFDEYSSKHLDLFYEDDYQPLSCSGFDRSENSVYPKKDSHHIFLQPPLITLPCYVIKGVVGNYILCVEFPQTKCPKIFSLDDRLGR
jgi:hypothetical protein